MNRLIGEKLSIISPKPQTTRMSVKGFLNTDKAQIVFLDTPGIIDPKYKLHEKMMRYVDQSLKGSDVVVFITDVHEIYKANEVINIDTHESNEVSKNIPKNDIIWHNFIQQLSGIKKPKFCIINKMDLLRESDIEEKIKPFYENFDKVFCISALKDESFQELIDSLISFLPFSPPLYDHEDLSDMPMRFFAQEIIREKIFLTYNDEIPYCSTVVVEKWSEEEDRDVIQANIWIERESQKPIVIGRNGTMIGKVRSEAENY
jgi:GTP-binding protein Era